MRYLRGLSFLLFFTALALVANATEYYASPGGSDSNPGTFTSPFKTLGKGVSVLKAGDILTLRGGLYASSSTVEMSVSGAQASPITVRAYSGEVPVIRRTTNDTTLLTGAGYLVFEDLVFDGNFQALEGIKLHLFTGGTSSHHIRVSRCTFKNHRGSGMLVSPCDYCVIENNTFENNGLSYLDHGIYYGQGDGSIIRNNLFAGNAGFGIHLYTDSGCYARSASGLCGGIGNVVTGNVTYNNGFAQNNGSGIVVAGDFRDTIVENNMSFGNFNEGIILDYSDIAPQRTIVRNNTFFGNGGTYEVAQIVVGFAKDTVISNNIADPGSTGGFCAEITSDAQGTVFDRNLYSYGSRFRVRGADVGLSSWKTSTGEANALIAIPSYVDSLNGDFHLNSSSPGIDAGSSATGHFAATDFDNQTRPQGAGIDIGADETGAGATCSYSISPSAQSFPVAGGMGAITVTAPSGCGWSALASAAWIFVSSGSSGSGNGIVNYSVAANSGAARSGSISVAGKTFNITQDGSAPSSLFFDDFEDGDASDWDFLSGSWSVVSGRLTANTSTVATALAPFDTCTSCTVEADLRVTDGGRVSLLAWYVDTSTNVELILMEDRDKAQLKIRSGGTLLAKRSVALRIDPATDYHVTLSFSNGVFRSTINGAFPLSATISQTPRGTVGFRVKSGGSGAVTGSFQQIVVY